MLISTITKKDTISENTIYRDFHRVGKILVERRLGDKEIQDLFKAVEKGYSNSGQNRTMIGRGKDVATDIGSAIANAYRGVANYISKSGPVSAFDTVIDQTIDKIKAGAGGDNGAVMNAVYKYRDFAKKYPVAQSAIYAGLIALAGLSGAGLGGAALLGGVKAFDKMLLGNKASSALWSGFVTGASAYALSKLAQAWSSSSQAAQTSAGQTAQSGTGMPAGEVDADTMARNAAQAKAYGTDSTDTLDQMNKAIMRTAEPGTIPADYSQLGAGTGDAVSQPRPPASTAPTTGDGARISPPIKDTNLLPNEPPVSPPIKDTNLLPADERPLPANLRGEVGTGTGGTVTSASGQPVTTGSYSGLNQATYNQAIKGLSPEQLARLGNANPLDPYIRSRLGLPALKETRKIRPLPLRTIVDRDMTVLSWQLNESLDRQRGGLQFNRRGVDHVFRLIEQQLAELDVKGARAQDVLARRGKASQRVPAQSAAQPTTAAPAAAAPAAAAEPPEYLRPTRPGAPVQQPVKPGLMSRIGQGLQTFGRQLTTNVTSEKLNTNWKVAGSPTDSDKLFYFLINQGVPNTVARQVYLDLKIQPPAATTGSDNAVSTSGATSGSSTGGSASTDPTTGAGAKTDQTMPAQSSLTFAQQIKDQFADFERSGGNPWSTVVMKTLQDLIYQGQLARRKLGESRKRIKSQREIKRTIREVRQRVNTKRARLHTL